MLASLDFRWLLLLVLAGLHVTMCLRMAGFMRRSGHNAVVWFIVSLFLTAGVPLLFLRHSQRRNSTGSQTSPPTPEAPTAEPARRCPHCQRLIVPAEPPSASAEPTCPHCGLPLKTKDIA